VPALLQLNCNGHTSTNPVIEVEKTDGWGHIVVLGIIVILVRRRALSSLLAKKST
jgi:hypothetical protein